MGEYTKTAAILRLQYPYGKSQTWMPMDLLKIAGQLDSSDIKADVIDLNLTSLPDLSQYDHVAMGVVGAPYIPGAITLAKKIQEQYAKTTIVGGPGVEYLTDQEFEQLFQTNARQIKTPRDLAASVNADLPSVYNQDISQRIANLDDQTAREYLSNEFSLFVSQGCKYACKFCAASRTRNTKVIERFNEITARDLEAIARRAKDLGINELRMYATSLDFFQTPNLVAQTLADIADLKQKYNLNLQIRTLSRVDSFLSALDTNPDLYDLIPKAGVSIIGFGVDGTTKEVWLSQSKGMKDLDQADQALQITQSLGATAEALMVMGFHNQKGYPVDTKETLQRNVDYADKLVQRSVVLRPHVAKDCLPGNNGWGNPVWSQQKYMLMQDPRLFKNLDYVAMASELTHPNPLFREEVNDAYLKMVHSHWASGMCATTPLMPEPIVPQKTNSKDNLFNLLARPDK